MKKPRIMILGAYGCGNRGDDAILSSIAQYFPDCHITATCGIDTKLKTDLPMKYISCRLAEGKITFPILCNISLALLRLFFSIPRTDAVIFGGGSNIHDLTAYNLPFWFLIQFWANIWGKQTYYVGMGVGPVSTPTGKKLCQKFLPHCTHVYVRDQRGYRICQELGILNVTKVNDAAFSLETVKPSRKETEPPYLCITASAWFRSADWWREGEDFQQELEANYKSLALSMEALSVATGLPLLFLPTFNHDEKIGRYLENTIPEGRCTCIDKNLSFQEMNDIIGKSHALVGMRMHSIIFALRQSVPVIAINYDEKVHQLMSGVGIADYCLELEGLTPESLMNSYLRLEENRKSVISTIETAANQFSRNTTDCLNHIRSSIHLPPYEQIGRAI